MALGAGYLFSWPRLLGKRRCGKMLVSSYVFFWPYHLLSFASLAIFRCLRVTPYQEIVPGLYLGGRLFPWETAGLHSVGVASVLDLTCELSEVASLRAVPAYFCIPLLDGTAPSSAQLESGVRFIADRIRIGPVYVHCAMGHGRGATVVIGYLLSIGQFPDLASTVNYVRSKRPGVRLRRAQMRVLEGMTV